MGSKSEFSIPFEGLKNGKHCFEFEIKDAFFDALTYSIIKGGDVKVDFELDKKETMMIGTFNMKGFVKKPCDRCTDPMQIQISVSNQIIYKFGNEQSIDENLIVLSQSEFEIDIAPTIYELLTVAIPGRNIHRKGKCNKEMLDLLDQYNSTDKEEESIDPRWQALNKLK